MALLKNKNFIMSVILGLTTLYMWFPAINIYYFITNHEYQFHELKKEYYIFFSSLYSGINLAILVLLCHFKKNKEMEYSKIVRILHIIGMVSVLLLVTSIMSIVALSKIIAMRNGFDIANLIDTMTRGILFHDFDLTILLFLIILVIGIKQYFKRQQFDLRYSRETTGNFGTASWASEKDLLIYNLFTSNNKILSGCDEKGRFIYLPLLNKLTISPQGGGKTTASSIPLLLSHDGPAFVFDIKGELYATTARYRSEILKRKVIVIDPYRVTKGKDFAEGKSEKLLEEYCFNPFDWIPEDQRLRDRMINAFAASFIINEGGAVTHFDDNAKILIRGYIDYMMQSLPKESRKLETLYHLLSEHQEQAQFTFEQMSQLSGRAAAASNQISRVGADERGSILSTSYRQIDWMGDSNIQKTLSCSNFDLRDFLNGNMDIFIVLPEDQVKDCSRLFRMMMALLMSLIVQANPSELPSKKIVLLLEEIAQLGYTPDVEQAIEVLRARSVVVWTVFQTLKQIEMFQKPDLFKGAPIKQIFTNDDTDTMQWIQTLGGKETIITKTSSMNSGDSKQKMQMVGGTVSKGEGESIQETGTELIAINEIREMPLTEQILFLHGMKPIYCKKVRYFECKEFEGRYDQNPLEKRNY